MFKECPLAAGYFVSPEGVVLGKQGKAMKQSQTPNSDYLYIKPFIDGKHKFMAVHRMVASTYVVNPDSLPMVNHIDGDKRNNSASNLEWCDAAHNMQHASANGLLTNNARHWKGRCGKDHNRAQRILVNPVGTIVYSLREASELAGCALATAHNLLRSGKVGRCGFSFALTAP